MNIGLFPMSGIRVCDAELLRLGLTLPGFVERSKTIASLPSLGLLTLAGMFDINFKPTHISGRNCTRASRNWSLICTARNSPTGAEAASNTPSGSIVTGKEY
ncbi:MAG: hypothetical protein NTV46_15780 [Verrucomicrobia bacterium]|nr:hypothetical protein [Verrucomicrobiota bacterium]